MPLLYSTLAALLAAAAPLTSSSDATAVAVMPLQAKRVSRDVVAVLDDLLVTSVGAAPGYRAISAGDINAMLGAARMRDTLGCSDVACASDIGGALGVPLILTGTVSRLGDDVIVTLALIDVRASEVRRRARVDVRNQENLFAGAVEKAVREALGAPASSSPATGTTTAAAEDLVDRLPASVRKVGSFTKVGLVSLATIASGGAGAVGGPGLARDAARRIMARPPPPAPKGKSGSGALPDWAAMGSGLFDGPAGGKVTRGVGVDSDAIDELRPFWATTKAYVDLAAAIKAWVDSTVSKGAAGSETQVVKSLVEQRAAARALDLAPLAQHWTDTDGAVFARVELTRERATAVATDFPPAALILLQPLELAASAADETRCAALRSTAAQLVLSRMQSVDDGGTVSSTLLRDGFLHIQVAVSSADQELSLEAVATYDLETLLAAGPCRAVL